MNDVHGKTLLDKSEKSFSFKVSQSLVRCLDLLELKEGFKGDQIQGVILGKDSILLVSNEKGTRLIALSHGTYRLRNEPTKEEVLTFVESRLYEPIPVKNTELLKNTVSKHHEYRGKPLLAYIVKLEHETDTKVYVHPELAKITTVRNNNWRRFDFLWMLHVMDFETRDEITNWMLRVFSILGLLTILSGFYLFYLSSSTIRKIKQQF